MKAIYRKICNYKQELKRIMEKRAFQDDYAIIMMVYDRPGTETSTRIRQETQLNEFISIWVESNSQI